jgi:hypothetical protein
MFAAYAWTLSFSDEPYHGLNLKAYAFHESTDTYTFVKGLVAISSIHDSARISIPRLTVQRREEYPREISFEGPAMPTLPLKKAYRFIWV